MMWYPGLPLKGPPYGTSDNRFIVKHCEPQPVVVHFPGITGSGMPKRQIYLFPACYTPLRQKQLKTAAYPIVKNLTGLYTSVWHGY